MVCPGFLSPLFVPGIAAEAQRRRDTAESDSFILMTETAWLKHVQWQFKKM